MRIDKAKQFIMENARAYERALYRYFFQNGSKDSVIKELRQYQNSDGGFGHGLEADNWNPNSNPIATNDAVITLYRIGALEKDSEIVQSIISYLYSHDSFDESQRRWLFAIDSNKDYPHAFWWEKRDDGIHGFNPTVSLATLCVCFGNGDEYYREIVQEAFDYLNDTLDVSGDALKCFLLSYEILRMNSMNNVIDLEKAHQVICERLESAIEKDVTLYGVEYVPAPSDFFVGVYEEFISEGIQQLIDAEKEVLGKLQKADGGFDISWTWGTEYAEFEQARSWWRPRITIDKLLFLER